MKKIYKCMSPSGRIDNMKYGFASILDGIIRVLSFGYFSTTFPLDTSREIVRKSFHKMKEKQNAK